MLEGYAPLYCYVGIFETLGSKISQLTNFVSLYGNPMLN
ncbi:hypothetical protein BM49_0951 [Streptococcus pneumoniae]|nr:hypothetical protein BM49_0951 [Streptococcus pneumoniae]